MILKYFLNIEEKPTIRQHDVLFVHARERVQIFVILDEFVKRGYMTNGVNEFANNRKLTNYSLKRQRDICYLSNIRRM